MKRTDQVGLILSKIVMNVKSDKVFIYKHISNFLGLKCSPLCQTVWGNNKITFASEN